MRNSFLIAALLTPLLADFVSADVLLTNATSTPGPGTILERPLLGTTSERSFDFTMGSTAYFMDAVTVTIDSSSTWPGSLELCLFVQDGAGFSFVRFFEYTDPIPAGLSDVRFDIAGTGYRADLRSGATYRLLLGHGGGSPSSYDWVGSTPPIPPSSPSGAATFLGFDVGSGSAVMNLLEIEATPLGVVTSFCDPATVNVTGQSAVLTTTGSTVVSMADFGVAGSNLPPASFALVLVGDRPEFAASTTGWSRGLLCINGPLGRFIGPGEVRPIGATGTFALDIDLSTIPFSTGVVASMPGDVLYFQTWYRDSVGGQAIGNSTNALRVEVL